MEPTLAWRKFTDLQDLIYALLRSVELSFRPKGSTSDELRAYLCCWRALLADMTRVVSFRQCVNPTRRSGCLSRRSQGKGYQLDIAATKF
ncbi:hypothetical protein GQ457_17G026000 [Hibiscus cannabinus]